MSKNIFYSKDIKNKMDKRSEDFLKAQFDIYTSRGIIFVSSDMTLTYNEETDKLKKSITKCPTTKDFDNGINTYRNTDKNSCYVPTGDKYDLLVVDVDNKNDTIKKFNKLMNDNDVSLDTLTVRTINNGFHYYYRPTKEQKERLKNFKSSLGSCFELDIDIKYNHGFVYGVSKVPYEDTFKKYKIINDTKVRNLPTYIFEEIIKDKTKTKKGNQINYDQPEENINETRTENESNEIDERLKIYLSACKNIKTRDEWLKIGNAIYNEGGTKKTFIEYSKQFKNYYDEEGLNKVWKSYKKQKYTANITSLIKLIEKYEPTKLNDIENQDTTGIINKIFTEYIINDDIISRLVYSLYPTSFIFVPENKTWYSVNQYGIWDYEGKDNIKIKIIIKNRIKSMLEKEAKKIRSEMIKTMEQKAKENDDEDMMKGLKKSLECFNRFVLLITAYMGKNINKSNVLNELSILYNRSKIYENFDNVNPYVFAFNNGVYDLKNNIFRNALPNELISITTKYDYTDNKNLKIYTDKIHKLLSEIFPDEEERTYMLNTLCLSLVGLNTLEEFYIWIGTGSNGKGVLAGLLSKTLGEYYDSLDIEYLVKKNSNNTGADPIMAKKKGKRGVITTELEKEVKLRESKLKELTGRDKIQVRELYGTPFNYVPVFKLYIQTNKKPEIDGTDTGLKRRLRLINFPSKFVDNPTKPNEFKIDRTLKDDFISDDNYPLAFFHILKDHLLTIDKDKFSFAFPERFKHETELFFKDNDPVDAFISDCCEETPHNSTLLSDLHKAYQNYCVESGFDVSTKNKTLKETIIQKGYTSKRTNKGFAIEGLKLKIKLDEKEPIGNIFKK